MRSLGLLLIGLGALIALIGVLVSVGAFNWFGRLPGDLRFEGERSRVYVPLGSMIVISIVLTILLNLFLRR